MSTTFYQLLQIEKVKLAEMDNLPNEVATTLC